MEIIIFAFTLCLTFTAIMVATWKRSLATKADRGWTLVIFGIGILFIVATFIVNLLLGASIYDLLTLSGKLAPRAPAFLGIGTGLLLGSIVMLIKIYFNIIRR